MVLCILLLTCILGVVSQATDMDGQVFLFPDESASSWVILKAHLTTPLQSYTICLRAFTELTRDYSLFSASSPTKDNELVLFHLNHAESPYSIYMGNQEMRFRAWHNALERTHICATWDSSTGVAQLWINGEPLARKVMKREYYIPDSLIIILGQEQDSHGGSFDAKQSFVGEIGDVQMWDYVVLPTDIQQARSSNKHFNGNVISWRALSYEIKGNVLVQPVQQKASDQGIISVLQECKAN